MKHKKIWTFSLAALALGAAACLCTSALPGGGAGEGIMLDGPEEDFVPNVDLPVEHLDEYGGMNIRFPAGWAAESENGQTAAAAGPAVLVGSSFEIIDEPTGPVVVTAVSPLEDFALEPGMTADDQLEDFKVALEGQGATFFETGDVPVGGFDGRGVFFERTSTATGQEASGRLYVVVTDQQVLTLIAMSPASDWFNFADAVDAIVDSITFVTPNLNAVAGQPAEPQAAPGVEPVAGVPSVTVANESEGNICYISVAPADSGQWGDDLLGTGVLMAGSNQTFEVAAGTYFIKAEDCEKHLIHSSSNVSVDGPVTWTVSFSGGPPVPLTLVNNSASPVCYVKIAPSTADSWGEDWLGAAQQIPPGGSAVFDVPGGTYDLQARDCSETAIGEQTGVAIDDARTWIVP